MQQFEVTFETKCYEKDWEILLKTDRIEKMIEFNQFQFKEKVLYINNVQDVREVSRHADKLVARDVLSSYVIVDDYSNEALNYFEVTKESFKGGYYYSISELVSIYLCKTEYLLHFSSDSILEKPFNWIDLSILKLQADERIKVANPVWNGNSFEAKQESIDEDENFYIGYGFSDQCYLIRTNDFKNKIYNEKNLISERYPIYGGELFEKRVDAWMRNNHFKRITFKHGNYIHQNY
ncbi:MULTISPECIES: hypothetical protein [unclassified Bacillus (in: firmicutes)]|uniref:hypothetical protein n=1 Tax=unclassified Bacillus (in: firmicutes) TaxID=185979 RepID=UPI0008E083E4|nr:MULTISPECIES: hypothetical protein [unclassified Bacillus (in: firmicutes)]PGZ93797.1 hypothetical protein COE53_05805 [Bacillus sp. AFS029533]SFD02362.1 hypothetical protein SAMN02799633_02432 [Bacillus sp. UNCCL81]